MNEKMNEKVDEEIKKAAEVLDMDYAEVLTKYHDICAENEVDADEWKLSLSLFRQWFSQAVSAKSLPQTETSSLVKKAFGYFISVNEARDLMELQTQRVKNEYLRDSDTTYRLGKVAVATTNEDGTYTVKRMLKAEEAEKTVPSLPTNNVEVEEGIFIIPLDTMEAYATSKNHNYGKPLPKEQFRMAGVFIGEVDGDVGLYQFSYKGEASKTFLPTAFNYVHMLVIRDQTNPNRIYGFKETTANTLLYNNDLDEEDESKRDMAQQNIVTDVMEFAEDKHCSLIDLEMYHGSCMGNPYAERYVITVVSVSSINMTPNDYGTRRLSLNDLNSDFDYDGGGWSGTTCWIPSHIDIGFGIGSTIMVVGRTSQRQTEGGFDKPTINVSGIYVIETRGSVVEPYIAEEDSFDWFS